MVNPKPTTNATVIRRVSIIILPELFPGGIEIGQVPGTLNAPGTFSIHSTIVMRQRAHTERSPHSEQNASLQERSATR
jgi:hypothetical protein